MCTIKKYSNAIARMHDRTRWNAISSVVIDLNMPVPVCLCTLFVGHICRFAIVCCVHYKLKCWASTDQKRIKGRPIWTLWFLLHFIWFEIGLSWIHFTIFQTISHFEFLNVSSVFAIASIQFRNLTSKKKRDENDLYTLRNWVLGIKHEEMKIKRPIERDRRKVDEEDGKSAHHICRDKKMAWAIIISY